MSSSRRNRWAAHGRPFGWFGVGRRGMPVVFALAMIGATVGATSGVASATPPTTVAATWSYNGQTSTPTCSPHIYTTVAPAGAYSATVTISGGAGNNYGSSPSGGAGQTITAVINTAGTAGQTYSAMVGCANDSGSGAAGGGSNGGGAASALCVGVVCGNFGGTNELQSAVFLIAGGGGGNGDTGHGCTNPTPGNGGQWWQPRCRRRHHGYHRRTDRRGAAAATAAAPAVAPAATAPAALDGDVPVSATATVPNNGVGGTGGAACELPGSGGGGANGGGNGTGTFGSTALRRLRRWRRRFVVGQPQHRRLRQLWCQRQATGPLALPGTSCR